MSTYENKPLEITQGATKLFTFVLSPVKDLTTAEAYLNIKSTVDRSADPILVKKIDKDRSTELKDGKFTIRFVPNDTTNLEARTYFYELKVVFSADEVYYPAVGDFTCYGTLGG